ncbi:ABC transporter ATP-binding protein [Glycomyces luteolus]|uniref:ABC transporter ATP-binding protein n=1 Tax=Glycomyces luteolus TaxID=2670330 RepID=A0A9X3PHM2_9ACTN|nr:ABC transporter ATP-binding protein [Glycomyces luteolus]MDA1362719.1 ABC transporter ATP-binding protein [Glycomyces luteolus]
MLHAVFPAIGAASVGLLISGVDADLTVPLVVFGAVFLLGQVSSLAFRWAKHLVVSGVNLRHRAEVARLAVGAPTVDMIEPKATQDLFKTAAADPTEWVEKTPGDGAIGALRIIFEYVGLISSAIVVSYWSFWLVPALIIPALVTRRLATRLWVRHYRIWVDGIEHHRRYQYWGELTASRSEAKELRIFGLADWIIGRHQYDMRAHLAPVWADDRAMARAHWQQFAITLLPLGAIFGAVGFATVANGTDVGIASAALAAGWGIFTAASGVGPMMEMEGARPGLAAFAALKDSLERKSEVQHLQPLSVTRAPHIRFEDVHFRYERGASVTKGLDLEIRPDESLAVVGFNGAGKSTLIKLLAGAYRPTAGIVTADGRDIGGIDDWGSHLAVVFQDFVKYRLTIAENIALGRSGPVDEAALKSAIAESGLQALVDGLPAGEDTSLDASIDGGVDLSGGQWQQLALARALYAVKSGARILVLDEPSAHLDVRTEQRLFDRLEQLTEPVTTILVSHRLATVRRADRIVLIDDGKIAEQGTHEELMSLGGTYARMYRLQAERFAAGFDDRLEEGAIV